jgi:hypothetical protein
MKASSTRPHCSNESRPFRSGTAETITEDKNHNYGTSTPGNLVHSSNIGAAIVAFAWVRI